MTLPREGYRSPPLGSREPARPGVLHDGRRRAAALDGSGRDWKTPVLMLARRHIRLIVPAGGARPWIAQSSARRGAAGGRRRARHCWWRQNPSACPYSQRFWVEAPHPFITRERLREVARAASRASACSRSARAPATTRCRWPAGSARTGALEVCRPPAGDARPHAAPRRASTGSPTSSRRSPTRARCRSRDATFDGAYLVTVLGEIPDQEAALRELRRVRQARRAGSSSASCSATRTWSPTRALAKRAAASGLRVDHRLGGRLWHFTRLGRDT